MSERYSERQRGGRYDENNDERRYGNYEQDEGRGQQGRQREEDDFGRGSYSQSGYSSQRDRGRMNRGNTGQNYYGQSGFGEGGYGYGSRNPDTENYGNFGQGRYSQGTFGTESGGRFQQWREPYAEGWQGSGDFGRRQGQGQGQHRGKGPKGYQRSDERIKELICERLSEDPEIDPSDVTVTVSGGKVTLEGTVESRQAKNAIEDIAEQFCSGEVQNNLRVSRQEAGRQGSSMSTSMGGSSGRTGTFGSSTDDYETPSRSSTSEKSTSKRN